jgi:hypothetical protein
VSRNIRYAALRRRSDFICILSPVLRDFLMESFDRFQLAGLALICLKNETKAYAERDLRELISAASTDVSEKSSWQKATPPARSAQSAPTSICKVQPRARWSIFFGDVGLIRMRAQHIQGGQFWLSND